MNELIGRKVTVYSVNGASEGRDIGVIDALDATWLKLKKADGETLYFGVYQIRLIKPFEPL